MAETIIELENVTLRYRRNVANSDISFSMKSGDYLAVFGPAASGKTTLLRYIAGRMRAARGSIRLDGRVGAALEGDKVTGLLTPDIWLNRQALSGDVPASRRSARVAEVLELLGLYGERDRQVRELSYSRKAGLLIAGAIVGNPAILLLDNITGRLEPAIRTHLFEWLDLRRADDQLTLIHATTDSSLAQCADRVLMLHQGKSIACEQPASYFARCAMDRVTVEADDPRSVQKTLRGVFDVEITQSPSGLTFRAADGLALTAHLFRHPAGGVRIIHLRPPDLWQVHAELIKQA